MTTKYSFDIESPWHTWFDDFDKYTAGDWTITVVQAGSGSAAQALQNADGGVLLITNDNADDDSVFYNWTKETFKWESGKALYFEARFKVLEAIQCDLVMGLQITDTTPLAVSDGIYFQKDDGDALLDFHVTKNGTSSDVTGFATLAADTYVTLAFYYDGSSSDIDVIVNGETVGSAPLTNVVDDEELTISFGIQNGQAVINTMSIDYILVKKFRG